MNMFLWHRDITSQKSIIVIFNAVGA
jgi:hypothetical protein